MGFGRFEEMRKWVRMGGWELMRGEDGVDRKTRLGTGKRSGFFSLPFLFLFFNFCLCNAV